MGRLSVLTERYKKQKGNGDLPVKIVVSFLASQKGFEPPTLRLGVLALNMPVVVP